MPLGGLTLGGRGTPAADQRRREELPMEFGSRKLVLGAAALGSVLAMALALATADDTFSRRDSYHPGSDAALTSHVFREIAAGKKTFRFETFGDEAFWGDTIRLHDGIQGAQFGGVGGG